MSKFIFDLQRFADVIEGTEGDDNISGGSSEVRVEGYAGNDRINFVGDNNTISGGDDNDYIEVTGDGNSITGGAGDDSIWSEGNNNTIIGSAGNDSIVNSWEAPGMVYVYGGGNDTIEAFFDDYQFIVIEGYTWSTQLTQDDNGENRRVIVSVLNGSDTVGTITVENFGNLDYENFDKYILPSKDALAEFNLIYNAQDGKNITGTDSNDRIVNNGKNLSITSGAGDDSILSNNEKVTINAGTGNNYICNFGDNNIITAGAGNDSVEFNSTANVYIYGGGDDTLWSGSRYNFIVLGDVSVRSSIQSDDKDILRLSNGNSLYILNGVFEIFSSLDEVPKVNVFHNDQNDTVYTINGEEDAINFFAEVPDNSTINGSQFNDHIITHGSQNVTVTAGAGDDTVEHYGEGNLIIDLGDGDDYINGSGYNISINAGAGNDNVDNWIGGSVKVDLGDGNDTVWNRSDCSDVTVKAGAGDDYIWNNASNVTIAAGEGNDYVNNSRWYNGSGYDELKNVTINAGTGDDTIQNDGDNILFQYKAGDGNDLIFDFNSTSTLQINGADYSSVKSGEDIIITVGEGNITLGGAANLDNINIIGAEIEDDADADTDTDTDSDADNIISGTDDDDNISNIYDNISIDAGAGNDSIRNFGNNVTILGSSGDDSVNNNNGINYEGNHGMVYVYGGGNDTIERFRYDNNFLIIEGYGWETIRAQDNDLLVNVLSGTETVGSIFLPEYFQQWGDVINIFSSREEFAALNVIINTEDNQTLTGGNATNLIANTGSNVSITAGAADDTIYTHHEEASEANVVIDAGDGNNYIRNAIGTNVTVKAGAGNDFVSFDNWVHAAGMVYVYGGGNDTLQSFNYYTYVVLGDTKINSSIWVEDVGQVLRLSNGKTLTMTNSGDANFVSSLDEVPKMNTTYNNDSNAVVTGKQEAGTVDFILNHNNANGATINGSELKDIISNWGSSVSIDAGAGNDIIGNIDIGSKATINAGDGDDTISNWGDSVSISGGAGNDFIVSYGSNVTIDGGEGDDTIDNYGSNITYNYTGGNDNISGIAIDNINLGGASILSSVDNNNGSWTLNLDNGNTITWWSNESDADADTDTDTDADTDADFVWKRDGNKLTYGSKDDSEILLELDGVEEDSTPIIMNNSVRLSDDNFSEEGIRVISNAGGYTFEIADGSYSYGKFSGNDGKDSITNSGEYINIDTGAGKDSIVNNSENVTISGGAGNDKIINNAANVEISGGAGNDNVTVSGGEAGNIFSYSKGDGKDILYNFDETDKIKIADDSAVEAEINGNDIVFKVGSGSITIHDGATTRREVLFVDSTGNEIDSLSGNEYTKDGIITYDEGGEAGIILTSTFRGTYTASEVANVDGSQTKKGIGIDASTAGNILIGGKGKDTLISGENNFELTGGKGNDVFNYNGGTGIITDYSEKGANGKDKILLRESLSVQEYEIADGTLVLGFSEKDSLTIEGGANTAITFGTKKSTVNSYTSDGVYDEKQKAVTLASDKENFDASKLSKLVTIDGSAAEDEIYILGNKKKNIIYAGDNGSTLNGGKGKDTLYGGDGADIFIYENKTGNKVISGYSDDDGDQISLGSGASLVEVTNKGNDLVLKVGKNKLTIEDGKDKAFTFVESGETKTFDSGLLISEDGESVSMTSAFDKSEFDFAAYEETKYQNVSAALLKKAVAITGDTENNELIGGKGKDSLIGGDGNDILRGGKGNDTLWGGSPDENYNDADTFVFWAGDGNDTIMDYNFSEDDMLRILSKNGDKEATFSNSVFNDGAGTLTLSIKGGGKIILANAAEQLYFNINDTTYHREGSHLAK